MSEILINKFDSEGRLLSPKLPEGKINYLIDIDGTISEDIPNEQPERMPNAAVIPGAISFVNKLYEAGHIITFFTSRLEEHRIVSEQWLSTHGFKWHNIVFGKPRGGSYVWIDDSPIKSIQFSGDFINLLNKSTI